MTKSRNILAPRHRWTTVEVELLRATYADVPTRMIAKVLGLTEEQVFRNARHLRLKKSVAYMASPFACRLRRGEHVGKAHQFPKGHVPANKGLRRPGWAPGRMAMTQFKPGTLNGRAAKVVKPIGAERVSKDGYLERKINNDLPFMRRWRGVHLLVWEVANGPLPRGNCLIFVNGDKTDIRIENLTCITRRENMARNTVHRLPAELVEVVQLKAALTRRINHREESHREKRNRGSAQPSVRDAGSAAGRGEADGA